MYGITQLRHPYILLFEDKIATVVLWGNSQPHCTVSSGRKGGLGIFSSCPHKKTVSGIPPLLLESILHYHQFIQRGPPGIPLISTIIQRRGSPGIPPNFHYHSLIQRWGPPGLPPTLHRGGRPLGYTAPHNHLQTIFNSIGQGTTNSLT